jgi:uracil-DNA glycosylase family 4
MPSPMAILQAEIENCARCPRLAVYRAQVAAVKRKAYAHWHYWGRPVAGFGDPAGRLWIIGLAPGAHGANRTGRVFTGDRSGDFLFAALHRLGLASQPTSVRRDDGLTLSNCFISAAARCAPPDNKPLPQELNTCADFLDREWTLLHRKRVILALGSIAWNAAWALIQRQHAAPPASPPAAPRPPFAHGATVPLAGGLVLVGSYHVSQQNTFTGRLTPAMFDAVLRQCLQLA